MNKKILGVLGVVVIVLVGVWMTVRTSSSTDDVSGTDINVYTTIPPIQMITSEILGDAGTVVSVLQPGASPHTYEPTPQDIVALSSTDVIFAIGHKLDSWVVDIADAAGVDNVVTVDTNITLRTYDDHSHNDEEDHHEDADEHHEDEHHDDEYDTDHYEDEDGHDEHAHEHGEYDPHYWLSPANALIIAATVRDSLSVTYPDNATTFAENYKLFETALSAAEARWESRVAELSGVEVITFHDAWGYFAEYVGMDIVATVEPFPGQQPTPQYLAGLQDTVVDNNVRAVFTEPQLASDTIEAFLLDTGATYGILDPLGGVSERDSYIELIEYNINTVIESL